MSNRVLKWCALGGPATVVIASAGFLISGLLPLPLGPSSTTEQVVDFYSQGTSVLLGLTLASLGVCFVFPLAAAIAVLMLRMEGRSPVLTFLQLITGGAVGLLLLLPLLFMTTLAFRPDRNPELTVTLNDVAWLLFITPIVPFMLQNVSIGLAVLNDKRQTLPRWVGYLNFWVAFLFIPDVLAFFFHSGPFGWNGIFIFWLAFVAYSAFALVMGWAVYKAADESTDLQASTPAVATA